MDLRKQRWGFSYSSKTEKQPNLYTRRLNGHTIPFNERFNSVTRLLGTLAIILRWLRRRRHFREQVIVAQELEDALLTIFCLEQEEHFADEI